jgi:hypothetical protein
MLQERDRMGDGQRIGADVRHDLARDSDERLSRNARQAVDDLPPRRTVPA